ncbi:MAG: mannose-1-phosphate guanylyltransferase [Flavobacteriales bacterium]|jgi:mannose-1-phosphate guanylyltransferase|nr:mannose-1-phosphate guanylyltransferase [Flavobacteriales bacterium]
MLKNNLYGLILAGGVGSRLWPISTKNCPKQFVDVLGDKESLIQKTYNRLDKFVEADQICFLTNENYTSQIISSLNLNNKKTIFEEPTMRNTAPALALASYKIFKKDPNAILLICPSDQLILNEKAFENAVNLAVNHLQNNEDLVTLGIQPDHPNTGYGYINYSSETFGIADVIKFTEKPNEQKAQEFLESGNYLWNAGIFLWKASYFVSLVEAYLPEIAQSFQENMDKLNTDAEKDYLAEAYPKFENISVDYAILEKCDNVKVIPVDMNWDDLGTFRAIEAHVASKDGNNTVINTKRFQSEKAENNFVFLDHQEDVLLVDVKDLAILKGNGKLVITSKEKLADLKNIAKKYDMN